MNNFQIWSQKIAQWAFVLLFFAAPISRSLFYICTGIIIIGWLLSGNWNEKWVRLKSNQASFVFLILIIWIGVSVLWSHGSPETIHMAVKRQWPLIIIPIITMIGLSSQTLKKCWRSFASGTVVLLVIIFLIGKIDISWMNEKSKTSVFYNPLPQSITLAIFALYCIYEILSSKSNYAKHLFLFLLMSYSLYVVFYINQQRSAYLVFSVGLLIIAYTKTPKTYKYQGLLLIMALLLTFASTNQKIQKRINLIKQDVIQYNDKNYYTSIGSRMYMWSVSLDSIIQKPIVGHGLGSYTKVIEEKFQDDTMCSIACMHPHNQFILFLFDYGMIGFILFLLALSLALWKCIKKKKTILFFDFYCIYC